MASLEKSEEKEKKDKKEIDFQKKMMNVIMETDYRRIISGGASAIDEYIVHKKYPLFIISLIDFKQIKKKQQTHLEPDQKRVLLESGNEQLSERFLFIVNIENKKALEAIKNLYPNQGGKIILIKNKALKPFLDENILSFNEKRFKRDDVKQLVEQGEIKFFKSVNTLKPELITLFNNYFKDNLEIMKVLLGYKKISKKKLDNIMMNAEILLSEIDSYFSVGSYSNEYPIVFIEDIRSRLTKLRTSLKSEGIELTQEYNKYYRVLLKELEKAERLNIQDFRKLRNIDFFRQNLTALHDEVFNILGELVK